MRVLWNNFLFALGTIPTSMGLALLMAVWVNGKLPGRALARMAYFTPTVLPMIAVADLWLFFYTPQIGFLHQLLFRFRVPRHQLLGDPNTQLRCPVVGAGWEEEGRL